MIILCSSIIFTLKDILYLQIRQLPESVIVETTEYKCLQSQFSVLYNESMQLKTQLDDARQQLQSSKNAHLRHIEMMEVNVLFFFIKLSKLYKFINIFRVKS